MVAYVGEIRMFAGNFAPVGWAFCDGTPLPISENEVLFQLIGTTYGGDGQETFNLPNLQSRVPVHMGLGVSDNVIYVIGEMAGTEQVTLTQTQLPIHSHPVAGTSTSQVVSPQDAVFATVTSSQAGANAYNSGQAATALVPTSILPSGGGQPHENCQPFLCINYIISLYGIFPSQT